MKEKDTKAATSREKGKEEIELRSEKVRNIIGQMPPALLRWGTVMVVLITGALLAAACLVRYPEKVDMAGVTEVDSAGRVTAKILIGDEYIDKIGRGDEAFVTIEGNDNYRQTARVTGMRREKWNTCRDGYKTVATVPLGKADIEPHRLVNASFLLSDKTIMQKILSK
jgi:hypothetical protein